MLHETDLSVPQNTWFNLLYSYVFLFFMPSLWKAFQNIYTLIFMSCSLFSLLSLFLSFPCRSNLEH